MEIYIDGERVEYIDNLMIADEGLNVWIKPKKKKWFQLTISRIFGLPLIFKEATWKK